MRTQEQFLKICEPRKNVIHSLIMFNIIYLCMSIVVQVCLMTQSLNPKAKSSNSNEAYNNIS